MSDFISLACPSCGGNLRITSDADRFACKYCGREHLVRRQGGILTVTPVLEKLDRIVSGVDRSASELAINRLRSEIGQLKDQVEDRWGYMDSWQHHMARNVSSKIMWIVGVWALALLLSLCMGGAVQSSLIGFVLGIPVAAGFTVLIIWQMRSSRQRIERKLRNAQDDITDLKRRIQQKQDELDRHRKIVRL